MKQKKIEKKGVKKIDYDENTLWQDGLASKICSSLLRKTIKIDLIKKKIIKLMEITELS